ncbi:HlyD family secretion protein [Sphingosinicella sp. LHD-64]|uniref:HlyD family secretion protein n=1 Tax=Sphingosinicella sp. LHD-64 TaxID=3072139 RepID=UPI00280CBEA5|nr:HlyD family secretion protein [Sphingosinicella sp. LHD-64]MDQ8758163.1 HlyD family secretion protein [Sphingosinicella sp. LHD-64]
MSEADPKPPVEAAAVATPPDIPAAAEPKKRPWRLILMLSVPLLLAAFGGYMWLTSGRYVSTDNAYVQQDMVSVAPEISGTVGEVFVRENQRVRRGDLLFRIDQRPYRIALANAEAQIRAAEVQVAQASAQVAGTGADIQGAQANLQYAEQNFARYEALVQRGFTTRTAYDNAMHDVEEARERLANARSAAVTARSALTGGGVAEQPSVQAARVARDQALLNLARTEVRAPADGIVTQTDRLQTGNAAVSGVPAVTIVRSATTYVEANYKETDLTNMYVGQPAEVELDAYPGVRVHGHVQSIGAGTGSQFSILPAQNATGNWVKVTQRVPVRIAVDADPGRPLIAGLSADVTVDTRDRPRQQVAVRH